MIEKIKNFFKKLGEVLKEYFSAIIIFMIGAIFMANDFNFGNIITWSSDAPLTSGAFVFMGAVTIVAGCAVIGWRMYLKHLLKAKDKDLEAKDKDLEAKDKDLEAKRMDHERDMAMIAKGINPVVFYTGNAAATIAEADAAKEAMLG